uniref:Formin 14 n=1 Tax=Solanum tuberosum TaxID=4113 RepID=M1A3Y4_SOLTU
MVSINLEKDWIEDSEYNVVDHVEKQETNVVGMKQEIVEDAPNGDMVAAIEVIKEEDPKKEISDTTCASGDLYKESIDGDVLESGSMTGRRGSFGTRGCYEDEACMRYGEEVLKNFLDTAEAEVKSLTTLYIEVGRSADSLSLYFGEDPARCPFEQVTQILVVFMKMFKKSRDENEQAADAEKKKLEKEALKEQVAASSSGKKGVGDADRVKLNFLNQLHAV